jgi:hypothetical protein
LNLKAWIGLILAAINAGIKVAKKASVSVIAIT